MPKVELHVHLEGSIRPQTVLQLARQNGVPLPHDTVEGLADWYRFRDFRHFVEVYVAVSKCIRKPEDIEFIAWEFLEGQHAQNILHSEVTYTASTIETHCGIPWDEQIDALERAMERARKELGVTMLLVIDIVRGDSPERAAQVADMALSGKGRGVGALGLAGPESVGEAAPYKASFERARAGGLEVIPHAGETLGPESIWEAIELTNARRIGHGVRCLEDPTLVEEILNRGIVLEVSPTSNVCVGGVPTFEQHPLPRLVEAGITVTLNSDDPPMFSTSLTDEYAKCSAAFGWDSGFLQGLAKTAAEHSMLSGREKADLLARLG